MVNVEGGSVGFDGFDVPIEKEGVADDAVDGGDGDHGEIKSAGKGILLVGIGGGPGGGRAEDFADFFGRFIGAGREAVKGAGVRVAERAGDDAGEVVGDLRAQKITDRPGQGIRIRAGRFVGQKERQGTGGDEAGLQRGGMRRLAEIGGDVVEHALGLIIVSVIEALPHGAGEGVVVVTGVHVDGEAELFEVAGALGLEGFLLAAGEGRQEERGENADNDNDDKEFGEGERAF
jgi:hypothetical protein